MTALAAMFRLERLAAHLLRGEPLPAADAAAIGGAILKWLDGREPAAERLLYEHLGLALVAGERDPRNTRRAEQRALLLRAAMGLMPGDRARADELHDDLALYFGSARWRADRLLAHCPYPNDTLDALLWQILKCKPAVPTPEWLSRIVATVPKSPLFATDEPSEIDAGKRFVERRQSWHRSRN